tara:strand:+ start:143 stop:1639 length:1497 start_codon:yes stop_codon:yes gene_type:complete
MAKKPTISTLLSIYPSNKYSISAQQTLNEVAKNLQDSQEKRSAQFQLLKSISDLSTESSELVGKFQQAKAGGYEGGLFKFGFAPSTETKPFIESYEKGEVMFEGKSYTPAALKDLKEKRAHEEEVNKLRADGIFDDLFEPEFDMDTSGFLENLEDYNNDGKVDVNDAISHISSGLRPKGWTKLEEDMLEDIEKIDMEGEDTDFDMFEQWIAPGKYKSQEDRVVAENDILNRLGIGKDHPLVASIVDNPEYLTEKDLDSLEDLISYIDTAEESTGVRVNLDALVLKDIPFSIKKLFSRSTGGKDWQPISSMDDVDLYIQSLENAKAEAEAKEKADAEAKEKEAKDKIKRELEKKEYDLEQEYREATKNSLTLTFGLRPDKDVFGQDKATDWLDDISSNLDNISSEFKGKSDNKLNLNLGVQDIDSDEDSDEELTFGGVSPQEYQANIKKDKENSLFKKYNVSSIKELKEVLSERAKKRTGGAGDKEAYDFLNKHYKDKK